MKKISQITAMLALAFTSFLFSMGQQKLVTINGRIISFEESLPLEGASVQVKESNNGTGTQADGSFSLLIQPGDKALLVKLDGYEPLEIPITKSREYNVVLRRAGNIYGQTSVYKPFAAAGLAW